MTGSIVHAVGKKFIIDSIYISPMLYGHYCTIQPEVAPEVRHSRGINGRASVLLFDNRNSAVSCLAILIDSEIVSSASNWTGIVNHKS